MRDYQLTPKFRSFCFRRGIPTGGNIAVTLYRQVGKGKARRYQKVNLGRGRHPTDLTGPYFLRYSVADGTRPREHVGDDLDEAIAARDRKQAYFEALEANVRVVQDPDDPSRTKITAAEDQWFAELQLLHHYALPHR